MGKAIDLSIESIETTINKTIHHVGFCVEKRDLFDLDDTSTYDLIIIIDVLEHIEDDSCALEKMKGLLNKGGYIMASFPIKMTEWRWDDDNYGHYRRYEIDEVNEMFNSNGLKLEIRWDITFPFIWAMRRLYTKVMKPDNLKDKLQVREKTSKSAFESAAGTGMVMKILERLPIWMFVFTCQNAFKVKTYGSNVLLLSKKDF